MPWSADVATIRVAHTQISKVLLMLGYFGFYSDFYLCSVASGKEIRVLLFLWPCLSPYVMRLPAVPCSGMEDDRILMRKMGQPITQRK